MKPIQFITGTDTGVGKTVWTGCLLQLLRESGQSALAMKPFCSGARTDVRLLQPLQRGELSDASCNPFWFRRPITPWMASRLEGRQVRLSEVLRCIRKNARRAEYLLVEGAGGLMSPLGERYNALDLIKRLPCDVWVVAHNRLGVLHQVLSTLECLKDHVAGRTRVVLMKPGTRRDGSMATNREVLEAWAPGIDLLEIPFLGKKPLKMSTLKKSAKKLKKGLAAISGSAIFCAPFLREAPKGRPKKRR